MKRSLFSPSLFRKDFIELFSSTITLTVLGVFLVVLGLFFWVVPGEYNVIDGGLAVTDSVFRLCSILLLVLIPAITMRSYSEEKRQGTWDLLLLRPISSSAIVWSKLFAYSSVVVIALLLMLVHPILIIHFSVEGVGPDWGVIATSFGGLVLWAVSLVAIGLFASLVSSNQPIAFVFALAINLLLNYGLELASAVPGLSILESLSDTLSLSAHYRSMQRGVIDSRDLLYFIAVILIFITATLLFFRKRENRKVVVIQFGIVAVLFFVSALWFLRLDFTAEKRYTFSNFTKTTLSKVQTPIQITIFMDGDLNAGFSRLKNGVGELIDEANIYANSPIYYQYIDPSASNSKEIREKAFAYMVARGMAPISVNETDRSGKISQKLIYPWAQIVAGQDTIRWSLLENRAGKNGIENLNASLESLELNFSESLHRLVQRELTPIAFLEGHNELPDLFVASALDRLAKNYRIDRGVIENDPSILSPYKVVVIAAPQKPFTEVEKYVIDQYIMHGGRVLWLIDGAQLPANELTTKGEATAAPLDLNLTDLLFNYGVRINPDLVQDAQCLSIPLKNPDKQGEVFAAPWIYAPVLNGNKGLLLTKSISPVKAEFVSSIDLVGETSEVKKEVLLATSPQSKILSLPLIVSNQIVFDRLSSNYFQNANIPVAVLLEGKFKSLFLHRFLPQGVNGQQSTVSEANSRMIVVSSSSIVRNEIKKDKSGNWEPTPLGYEPYEDVQYGNLDFVTNCVQYLAGDEELIALRSRQFQLRILDKVQMLDHLTALQIIGTIIPVLVLSLLVLVLYFWRKRKFSLK